MSEESATADLTFADLSFADLEAAFAQLESLGRFFGALAERDTNGFARERWRRLGVNYQGTAKILRDLAARGDLILDDLPEGRSSGILDDRRIVLDRSLDGRWLTSPLQTPAVGGPAARRRDILEPVLMQALARRLPSQDWPWLSDHLRAVGGLAKVAQEPLARPLLASFFHAKDSYLWLALRRVAQGDPAARQALARRQVATFNTLRTLRGDMAATFGAAVAERIQRDWAAYVAQVDGFAATRGWVLLDPALRRTQVGALAEEDADAVDRAAAKVVASAPRSALAAARASGDPPAKLAPAGQEAWSGKVPLSTILALAQSGQPDPAALAARLPLDTLALRPEVPAAANSAAFRAFAAQIKEALRQPDPRRALAEKEAALGAAQEQVSGLRNRVGELDRDLADRAAEAARLEDALAQERARLAAAERRAAEQAATAAGLSAEVEELTALKSRVGELDRDLADRAAEAARLEDALAQERARLAAAERRAAEQSATAAGLSAEVEELTALKSRVGELDRDLADRAAEAARLEDALAQERARLAAAERRAAEQAATAAGLSAEVEELIALKSRVGELDRDLQEERLRLAEAERRLAAERSAAQAAAAQASPVAASDGGATARPGADDVTALLSRIEQRQLFMMIAIAVVFLIALLVLLRGRRRPAAVLEPQAPLLLTAPLPPVVGSGADAAPERPVIDVEEAPASEADSAPPGPAERAGTESQERAESDVPRPRGRVNGVMPETVEARAAMKAGAAIAEAVRAAALGSETDAAAHPIVRALRSGNLPLFELLFSELTGLHSPQLQRIAYGGQGEDLAIVCRAVGVEKLLFGSIFLLTDQLRGGDADEDPSRAAEVLRMYDRMPPATAQKVLTKWQRNWGEEARRPEESGLV